MKLFLSDTPESEIYYIRMSICSIPDMYDLCDIDDTVKKFEIHSSRLILEFDVEEGERIIAEIYRDFQESSEEDKTKAGSETQKVCNSSKSENLWKM